VGRCLVQKNKTPKFSSFEEEDTMKASILSKMVRIPIHTAFILLLIATAWLSPVNGSGLLPGSGVVIDTGTITIPAGETARLEGTLAGNVQVFNYGTMIASDGQVKGYARIDNYGTISDLNILEYARIANSNSGYVGNLQMNGATLVNSGYVNNMTMTGAAQSQNNNFVNNATMFNNIFMQNNGTVNNAKLFAGNGDNIGFQNNGTTNNVDADVFSPKNNGFINLQNNGLVKNMDVFDNVPWKPGDPLDLVTVNNVGTIQNMRAGSAGIGEWDLNNWGSVWSLDGSGYGRILFSGDKQMRQLSLSSLGQVLYADTSNPLILDHDITIGVISLGIDGSLYVGQSAAPVPVPGTAVLLSTGLGALTFIRASRKRNKRPSATLT
jgi:hypothetical protein